jgi:serine O-acetyltransferase
MFHLKEDIDNVLAKDPAARSWLEVILCYPGFHAVNIHRLSHLLWQMKLVVPARFLSQLARFLTGIEIHPGAQLGRRVFIDHGMGVVIGETTIVGNDVVIYQGVTLGAGAAARKGSQSRGSKRHPTLLNNVVVGSGAEIQGDITVGNNVQVASGSIVLKDVPDNSVVVGVPGRVIYRDGVRVKAEDTPDIEAEAIKSLKDKLRRLEEKVTSLAATTATTEEPEDEAAPMPSPPTPAGSDDPVDVFLHGAGI